jgi:hypothetical protein
MSENAGAAANESAYARARRQRAERPAGGNFLSAKGLEEGRDLDVRVLTTEMRPGYRQPGQSEAVEDEPYWSVEASGQPTGVLVKENQFMSDWLEDHNVADPVGKTFRLVVITHKGNRTFKIARLVE